MEVEKYKFQKKASAIAAETLKSYSHGTTEESLYAG